MHRPDMPAVLLLPLLLCSAAPATLRLHLAALRCAAAGIFLGLWLNQEDGDTQLLPGGFDGEAAASISPCFLLLLPPLLLLLLLPQPQLLVMPACAVHVGASTPLPPSRPPQLPAGFYTYFGSEAVSYGANPANWPTLSRCRPSHFATCWGCPPASMPTP